MNAPYSSLSHRQERKLLNAARAVTRTDLGNPARTGCPGSQVLELLARRHSSVPDSADLIDHIGTCSPCFIEYSRYRAAHKRRVRTWCALSSAAIIGVVFLAATVLLHGPKGPAPTKDTTRLREPSDIEATPVPGLPLAVTVDLSALSTTRGHGERPQNGVHLPPKILTVRFLLPMGMEAGVYHVRLQDSTGLAFIDTCCHGAIQQGIVSLDLGLDLRAVRPGRYVLMIRPPGLGWRTFPITVG